LGMIKFGKYPPGSKGVVGKVEIKMPIMKYNKDGTTYKVMPPSKERPSWKLWKGPYVDPRKGGGSGGSKGGSKGGGKGGGSGGGK